MTSSRQAMELLTLTSRSTCEALNAARAARSALLFWLWL
jgi:hypothetical protein